MLRRFEASGWLSLEIAPSGRHHSVWLDHWLKTCPYDYAVFVDSDVEFRRTAWLRQLVTASVRGDAVFVAAEMIPEVGNYAMPTARLPDDQLLLAKWFRGHPSARLAARPAPWLLMVHASQAEELGTSFAFQSEEATVPEGLLAFDVGGAIFKRATDSGLLCTVMPISYRSCYHHYGGLSWLPLRGRRGLKKVIDLFIVRLRLFWLRLSLDLARTGPRLASPFER